MYECYPQAKKDLDELKEEGWVREVMNVKKKRVYLYPINREEKYEIGGTIN